MATYNLEEQEKLAELQVWWKQHGTLIVLTVALGLIMVAAIRGWDAYKQSQASKASVVYAEVLKAAEQNDARKITDLSNLVREDYPRTAHASLTAFVAAKFHVEHGDGKAAHAELQWVVENGRDAELKAIARVRLAQVLLDEQAYDEALRLLEAEHSPAFEAQFAETRGDIYAVQGKSAEARAAYQAALAGTPTTEKPTRELLQFKLDGLGES